MMQVHRYFLDANIIISGLLWKGNERKLLLLGEEGKVTLLTSAYVIKEVEDVLMEFEFEEQKITEFLVYLRSFIALTDVGRKEIDSYWGALDDKGDIPVLAAAIKSESTLITGDKELLEKGNKYLVVKQTIDVLNDV